ncbi:ATP-binding protein [Streptomyces sp. NPDC057540]|uniref:ATP-binding protein n=1 Tax=Streptomyces sp. NPDC057540 TaxID=3346160 RepID=UPI0036BDDCDB
MSTATTTRTGPATLHVPLPSAAQAARQARHTAALLLTQEEAWCPAAIAEDLVLIVSELVTNAVLHAEGPYALTIGLERGRAGVAVSDGSAVRAGPRGDHGRAEPGGRGLRIVRALGADLFVSPSRRGKQVIAVLTW